LNPRPPVPQTGAAHAQTGHDRTRQASVSVQGVRRVRRCPSKLWSELWSKGPLLVGQMNPRSEPARPRAVTGVTPERVPRRRELRVRPDLRLGRAVGAERPRGRGGVLIARVRLRSRLPAAVLTASQTSSVTTCSPSTMARLGSKPCRAPGSAGSGKSDEPECGLYRRSWKTCTRSDRRGSSSIIRRAMPKTIPACRASDATHSTCAHSVPSASSP
jgi:hypothetical protein